MQTDAPVQYREVTLDTRGIKADVREISVAFSSETPVERQDWRDGSTYLEILDHSPGNADLARLNNSGAFLVNHNTDDQVGAVKPGTAKVGADRVGRATIRMSRSARASEIFQDMTDGIRSLISFGYKVTKELGREVINGIEHRRFAFRAYEISSVPIPADLKAGVGRSQSSTPKKIMSLEINEPNRDHAEIEAIARHLENRSPGIRQLADQAIAAGTPLETFRQRALEMLPRPQPIQPARPLDVKPKDWKRYSLSRAIVAQVDGKLDGFEREMSDECALKYGEKAQGFWVPDEVMAYQRNAIAGTATLGGMLVQTDNLGDQFIDVLRNKSAVLSLGARVLNLSRQTTIPRQSGSATANWINGETAASTLSGINLQQLTLTPNCIAAQVQFSKLLLMESDPSVDSILKNDLAQQIGLAIDLAALHGSGSNGEPTGILATTGIGSVLLSANGLAINNTTAFPSMVSLESVVAAANADAGSLAYLMRPGVRAQLKTTPRFSNVDTAVWQDGKVNGYRAEVSAQVSKTLTTGTATTISTPVFFGNWADLLLANFGPNDLVVDELTLAANRVCKIYLHRFVTIGVRHSESFAVLGGVLGG